MLIPLFLALAAVAQQKLALTKPDAAYAEPFTSIRGVRELANGKVLVSDVQDKVVQLVDLAAGTAIKIGREGQGPEEYMLPMGLFAMPDGIADPQRLIALMVQEDREQIVRNHFLNDGGHRGQLLVQIECLRGDARDLQQEVE